MKALLIILPLLVSGKMGKRGIDPRDAERYTKGTHFDCDKDVQISISSVNDDYCDCADGTDEPSTSACNNGSFYCQNEGHVATRIKSFKVDDGICDIECCDGSDELNKKCPNVCSKIANQEKEQKRILEEIRKKGVKGKLRLIATSRLKNAEILKSIEELKVKFKSSLANLKTLRQTYRTLENENKEYLKAASSWLTSVVNTVKSVIQGDPTLTLDTSAAEDLCAAADHDGEKTCNSGDLKECREFNSKRRKFMDKLDESLVDYTKARIDLRNIRGEIADKEGSVLTEAEIEDAYTALRDTCMEFTADKYNYRFCWFKDISQDGINLGNFKNTSWVVKDGRMKYTDGTACWNGPIRASTVQLSCDSSEKVISIAEPNMCEYFVSVGTSAFCDILPGDSIQELQKEIDSEIEAHRAEMAKKQSENGEEQKDNAGVPVDGEPVEQVEQKHDEEEL